MSGKSRRDLVYMVVTDGSIRFCDLYGLLYNPDWLTTAYRHVKQNAGSKTAGCDGISMRDFDENFEGNFRELRESLKAGTFEPLPVRRRTITETRNGRVKQRPLGIPSIRDRIVQEALRMILEPIFEAEFSRNSYGFRPNRCTKDAVAYIGLRLTKSSTYGWIIEGDIQSFFDTIDHPKLMKLLGRRIKDKRILTLIWKFLRAGVMERGNLRNTMLGTPQGGIVSPLLANIYLHELDKYMERLTDLPSKQRKQRKRRGQANFLYTRYADDFVVLCDGTKEQAEEMRQELKKFLTTELKLTLSMEKTKITHVGEGFRFLGFWIERNVGRNGKLAPRIRIPEEAMERFRDKYTRALGKTSHEDSINLKTTALNRIIQGWCQYYQTTSSPSFMFKKTSYEIYWLMVHWLGRKYQMSTPKVMRNYKKGNTFGTENITLRMPIEYKTKRYQAKTITNPFIQLNTAITRENWDDLLEEWGGTETRKGNLDLKEWVFQRDKGICGICGKPVERWEAELDHKTPWSRFKHQNAANHEDNLWILHGKPCHRDKTKRDLQSGSRVR
jgi:RNA-directed DNA polymerase